MSAALYHFISFLNYGIFFFAVSVAFSYLLLAIISGLALREHFRNNRYVDYSSLLTLPDAPGISVLAPAFNEAATIKENVKSLLAINYNNFEVIVINDGSKDDTLTVLKDEFDLEPIDNPVTITIACSDIKNVYRSRHSAFKKLLVVDKINGGKADALNAGINVATRPYIVCIDVDCIMDKDVLLKLAKPYLQQSTKRVIATGGVVRIANSCEIKGGKIIKVRAPENMLARIQVLEYLRAFTLGRMAWSKLDGLLLISGAFGMFDKAIVIAAGGYNHRTVGEDMELVVRMRRYMIERKEPYEVQFIPEPLCWTEVPESYSILRRQRSRWTRGTMETLWIHKRMMFNPKYGVLGLLSYPYWLIYEYLAPWIESFGIIYSIILMICGLINWHYFFGLLILVYCFALFFSALALFTEYNTFRKYSDVKDVLRLTLAAIVEPFIFHPFTVYAAIHGNIEKWRGKTSWGTMTRKGFRKVSH
jgi:poly-beta-1,6-N-acetyl-D-glucosamine synthase